MADIDINPTVQTSLERIHDSSATNKVLEFIEQLIQDYNSWFDREWQEKILLVEIISFIILIILAGVIWSKNKVTINRVIQYSTENSTGKKNE